MNASDLNERYNKERYLSKYTWIITVPNIVQEINRQHFFSITPDICCVST